MKSSTDVGISEAQHHGPPTVLPSLPSVPPFLQAQTQEPLERVLAMSQGDGENSYSKNSGVQAVVNSIARVALSDALQRVTLPAESGGPVVLADLGCSSGPNSIDNIAFIVDSLKRRLPLKHAAELQAFFNDLVSNDFDNLFQLLSNDSRAQNFYAAGLPGSFCNRLLPRSSLHVFFSSHSVHWLSKIPDAVLDQDSPSYNGGKLWLMHSKAAVSMAYQQQAAVDLKSFLLARVAELVHGGLLFFICFGRLTSQPNEPTHDVFYYAQEDLDEVWDDVLAKGLVTEQQRDTINLPNYRRSLEEVEEAVASCGSLFRVLKVEMHPVVVSFREVFATSDSRVLAGKMADLMRSTMNNVFEAKAGKRASEIIWQNYEKLVERRTGPIPTRISNSIARCAL